MHDDVKTQDNAMRVQTNIVFNCCIATMHDHFVAIVRQTYINMLSHRIQTSHFLFVPCIAQPPELTLGLFMEGPKSKSLLLQIET